VNTKPVRVLIVDDQALVRRGLAKLLEIEDAVDVVGEAADGVEALKLVPSMRPDVALVDARMPRMDGVELIERLTLEHPRVAAIVLTTFDDDEYVFGGLTAAPVSIDPHVVGCLHETVFEGSQVEGARRG
jgi:YesN/AraC family two-component response regulator